MDPETRDPGAHHPPAEARQSQGSRPRQAATRGEPANTKAPRSGHREPPIYRQAETPATGWECGAKEIGPTFDGGPKLIQERERLKTQPDTKTGAHSHNHTFSPSCVHIKTLTLIPNEKSHNNGCRTLTHTPHTYAMLPGPGTDTPEGQPAPGPRRWSLSYCPNLNNPGPGPDPPSDPSPQ
ncbi:hypothetical protein ILYODFUR_002366 [Ilyodon furcidens]|uniref:Uncharacterized protein n=1 Tax=Ilyodon furcidens TaxID=33524 RepID=A0ABV0V1P5_9TELE